MKKILIVMPNLNRGGAERTITTLANNLDRGKFKVTLVLVNKVGHYLKDLKSDIEVIDLKKGSVLKASWSILSTINREEPDIVFSSLGHVNLLLMMLKPFFKRGIKLVAREASIPSIMNEQERFTKLLNMLYKKLYPKFEKVVCQSQYMKKDLETNFDIPSEKLTVINNPIDFKRIERNLNEYFYETLDKRFIEAKKRVLAVGSLEPIKQFDKLIESFSNMNNSEIKLFIIGEGSQKRKLEELIEKNNLSDRVFLLGFQRNPYIYMKYSNLVLLTSKFEGFPNVVLESMACGTPVLSFKCPGGIEEIIIEDINGWFVKPDDFNRLISSINLYVNHSINPIKVKRSVYNRYSLPFIMKKYETLFEEV